MAWCDILYSDNPKRRDKLVRLCSKVFTLLESNFRRTNELIDCIHEHIPGKQFSKVRIDMDACVKSNCTVLIKRIDEINHYTEQRLRRLAEELDRDTFYELTTPDTSFKQKLRIAQKLADTTVKISFTAMGVVVLGMIRQGSLLVNLTLRLGTLSTCVLASVGIGLLGAAVEILIGAIIGEIEKRRLESAIKDIEAVLDTFEPASDNFNRTITRLIIRIQDS